MPVLLSFYFIFFYLEKKIFISTKKNKIENAFILEKNENCIFLFVFAHPDDECMFFSPTIKTLCKKGDVHFICLSLGFEKKQERKQELMESALKFGIKQNKVHCVDSNELKDGKHFIWNPLVVCKEIEKIFLSIGIPKGIFTFDEKGVSSHPNHISVFKGTKLFVKKYKLNGFKLKTFSLFFKYNVLLKYFFLKTKNNILQYSSEKNAAIKSMYCHKTQLYFYRKLFIRFSLYSFLNLFSVI